MASAAVQGRLNGVAGAVVAVCGLLRQGLHAGHAGHHDQSQHYRILNGSTEITDEVGRYRAILEFPIKTMNVNHIKGLYQVDTGPVLLPDFTSNKERMVECFQLAFVAYNRIDEAYFVIQEPTSIVAGSVDKVSYYSKVVGVEAKNTVIALH